MSSLERIPSQNDRDAISKWTHAEGHVRPSVMMLHTELTAVPQCLSVELVSRLEQVTIND